MWKCFSSIKTRETQEKETKDEKHWERKPRSLTLACSAICLTSSGRLRSDTIFATLVSTKPSRSERMRRYRVNTLLYNTKNTNIWMKVGYFISCITFPTLQRDQVALIVQWLYKHLHKVELALSTSTHKMSYFINGSLRNQKWNVNRLSHTPWWCPVCTPPRSHCKPPPQSRSRCGVSYCSSPCRSLGSAWEWLYGKSLQREQNRCISQTLRLSPCAQRTLYEHLSVLRQIMSSTYSIMDRIHKHSNSTVTQVDHVYFLYLRSWKVCL